MKADAETTFKITSWDEKPTREFDDGSKLTVAHVTQQYEGQLAGSGAADYIMCHTGSESAEFVGFELIEGTFDGKEGSFIIHHDGVYEGGVARSRWSVVANSGRNELTGIHGSGSFEAAHGGEAAVTLKLTFS